MPPVRVRDLAAVDRDEAAEAVADQALLDELAAIRAATRDDAPAETDRAYVRAFHKAHLDLDVPDPGAAIARPRFVSSAG